MEFNIKEWKDIDDIIASCLDEKECELFVPEDQRRDWAKGFLKKITEIEEGENP